MTAWVNITKPTTGSSVSKADFGDKVIDNLNVLRTSWASVSRSAVQSIPNDTQTTVIMDGESLDTGSYFTLADPTKITIPKTGLYAVSVKFNFAANSTGVREVACVLNGSNFYFGNRKNAVGSSSYTAYNWMNLDKLAYFTAGYYFEIKVLQNSGGALDINAFVTTINLITDLSTS